MAREHQNEKIADRRANKSVWLGFTSIVAVLAIGLSTYFGLRYHEARKVDLNSSSYYERQIANVYHQSLYRLSDSLENTEANLGKILVSNDIDQIRKLLIKTEGLADSSVADMNTLPAEEDIVNAASRYFNQLSDYCKNIGEEMNSSDRLTKEQKSNLRNLKNIGASLSESFRNISQKDDTILWNTDSGGSRTMSIFMDDINENTFEYPQLVYDGPFSDSVTQKTFDVEVLSHREVEQKLRENFKDYNLTKVEFKEEVAARAKVYLFDVTFDGDNYTLETARDGTVAQLNANFYNDSTRSTLPEDQCGDVATKMAQALGYDVKPMWVSQTIDGTVYVNMISREGDTLLYPDMVKMAVDCTSGKVVGIDAFGYIANHKTRQLPTEYASVESAKKALNDELVVNRHFMAVVPKGNEEVFCYEFHCTAGGDDYLIYIDAQNLKEIEILKIVDGQMGYTVM